MTPQEAIEALRLARFPELATHQTENLLKVVECLKNLQSENERLKKELENAIIPKFKIGQEVWHRSLEKVVITKVIKDDSDTGYSPFSYDAKNETDTLFNFDQAEFFLTEAEALASLENKGE